jgi:isochorismate synthase
MIWLRREDGVVGWGCAAQIVLHGPDRIARAAAWWEEVVARAEVSDEVGTSTSGLIALGSFAFDDASPQPSMLVVPSVIVGKKGAVRWITRVTALGEPQPTAPGQGAPSAEPTCAAAEPNRPAEPTHTPTTPPDPAPGQGAVRWSTRVTALGEPQPTAPGQGAPSAEPTCATDAPGGPAGPQAAVEPNRPAEPTHTPTSAPTLAPGQGAAPAGGRSGWGWPGVVRWGEGERRAEEWPGTISEAIRAIEAGEADKVVLARDEWAIADQPFDLRAVADHLARAYPSCWTYGIGGMVGATPELLVRSSHGLVTSRVLAGTIQQTDDDVANLARAAALARSSKDLEEHEFAVASVAQSLAEFTEELSVPEVPYVLHLANVMHLASDVAGVLRQGEERPSSLRLAGALHPTAAVCGTPTDAARRLLARLEGSDRGGYAGPVGWINAAGDGEWGIALRGAQLSADRRRARLFAGGGIVRASVPEAELAETEAKLAPMRSALAPRA